MFNIVGRKSNDNESSDAASGDEMFDSEENITRKGKKSTCDLDKNKKKNLMH
jgi:hypothetical protein